MTGVELRGLERRYSTSASARLAREGWRGRRGWLEGVRRLPSEVGAAVPAGRMAYLHLELGCGFRHHFPRSAPHL